MGAFFLNLVNRSISTGWLILAVVAIRCFLKKSPRWAPCLLWGIVAREDIALQAIPQCNITCITKEAMKTALSGYLEVLYEFQPELVGGAVPGDDFYY